MASHLVSLWNSGLAQFGNDLLFSVLRASIRPKNKVGLRPPEPRTFDPPMVTIKYHSLRIIVLPFSCWNSWEITFFCTVCSLCSLVQSFFICFIEPKLSVCLKTAQFQSSWWDLGRVSLHFAAFGNNVSLTSSTNLLRKQKPTTLHQTQAPYHGAACPLLHLAVIR